MKPMGRRDLVRRLRKSGAVKVREDGDHEVWRVGKCQTYVPKHRTVSVGVCRSIQDAMAPCLGRGWLQ